MLTLLAFAFAFALAFAAAATRCALAGIGRWQLQRVMRGLQLATRGRAHKRAGELTATEASMSTRIGKDHSLVVRAGDAMKI